MAKTTVTLVEVARLAGVSQSTVSRILNNSTKGRFSASEEVRQRVFEAARQLNYRPSFAARNLAATRTRLVSVIGRVGFWSDRVGPGEEAVAALTSSLDAQGYEICLQFLSERHSPFDPPPLKVDGVVAVGAPSVEDLGALEEAGLPYVSLNGMAGPNGSLVCPDDAGGTLIALKHFHALGHRTVAYLDHASVDAVHPSVTERRDAFFAGIDELGLESPDLNLPLLGRDQPWDSYYEPFLRRAVMQGGATAVLTYSHQGALSLLRVAHELGLVVPRDFSLACFNNAPVTRLFVPSITAIDVPSVQMGQVAADLLVKRMVSENPPPPERTRIDESLVVRESSAPPS